MVATPWLSPIRRHAPAAAGTRSATMSDQAVAALSLLELLLQTELTSGVGQQVAEPLHASGLCVGIAVPAAAPGRVRHRSPSSIRAPPSPFGTTRHGCARRRRSASMSSGSVVVISAWGSSAMRRTRWPAPVRVELAEDVVEEEQRRAAVELGQQVELGQLEGEDRRPLLAA